MSTLTVYMPGHLPNFPWETPRFSHLLQAMILEGGVDYQVQRFSPSWPSTSDILKYVWPQLFGEERQVCPPYLQHQSILPNCKKTEVQYADCTAPVASSQDTRGKKPIQRRHPHIVPKISSPLLEVTGKEGLLHSSSLKSLFILASYPLLFPLYYPYLSFSSDRATHQINSSKYYWNLLSVLNPEVR